MSSPENQALISWVHALQANSKESIDPIFSAQLLRFFESRTPEVEDISTAFQNPAYALVNSDLLGSSLPSLFKSETRHQELDSLFLLAIRLIKEQNSRNLLCNIASQLSQTDNQDRPEFSQRLLNLARENDALDVEFAKALSHGVRSTLTLKYTATAGGLKFESPIANFLWSFNIEDTVTITEEAFAAFHGLLAKHRPIVIERWSKTPHSQARYVAPELWCAVLSNNEDFEEHYWAYCRNIGSPHALFHDGLIALWKGNPSKYQAQLLTELAKPEIAALPSSGDLLVQLLPEEATKIITEAIEKNLISNDGWYYHERTTLKHATKRFHTDGKAPFKALISSKDRGYQIKAVEPLIRSLHKNEPEVARDLISKMMVPLSGDASEEGQTFFRVIEIRCGSSFFEEWIPLLFGTSIKLQEISLKALNKAPREDRIQLAERGLKSRKASERFGAILLLKDLGEDGTSRLKNAYHSEKSLKLQEAIAKHLASQGIEYSDSNADSKPTNLLAQIESDKRIKLPTAPWFDLAKFPLIQKDGSPLPEKATIFLIQNQSKHKTIDAAPGILPVLEFLDREKNADAALTLLNQWLESDQVAKDRWALVLAGLLGDNRIIPALTPRIQPWCENSRYKLAEYAAQAISLLATEEALMILDTLANRYRSKFKNIGKACTAAFLAAAESRGVTPDELGDLVVPDLGFNSERQKEFDDGKIIAVLQPDFKITWLNPETEKETKSPPSNLSDEAKEELKTLRKILREAVKGQTARLEQMLVRQRRWPVARWQELFEEHPLLQSYAANLVWGIYHSNSDLLRTFRRYPNGILAHGSGEMEDLEERDTQIGLVHPLELDAETLATWRDHLGRFKVKPPFPQLDRPVEVLEDDHGNRREITFTENVQISGGTFLSRMNKRGWIRGSVIDGGGVTCYYKPFEGAGAEAILFLEEYWVGFDPVDSFPLGKALFATLSTVDRGSYIYDDPQPNDPRVLPFGKVPPIVYSEIIADLKALIEGQTKS